MTFSARSLMIAATAAIALAGPLAAVTPAAAQTKLKVVLNWKYQGPQGMFFLADDRGYFKAEGIEVQLDQGNGSGGVPALVGNGTYDVGFGDLNALIELAAKKPEDAPVAVYVMYNQPPFTIAVKADGPIKTAKDLEGKSIGGPANDGALKLFPAFCKIAKIDCTGRQALEHAAEPAREHADAGPGRRRVRLRQHHPLLGQARQDRRRQDPLHQVLGLRHGSLFQRHHRVRRRWPRRSLKW